MQKKSYEIEIGGKLLVAEFNDLAPQANGSVMIRYGETVVLVTVCMGASPVTLPYLPLSVEFEEKFYAAGAILGSRYIRREGRPSDEAVLAARAVDRTIRPLFPSALRHEVQVIVTVLAVGEDDPDLLGIIGTSLALSVSDIPWSGPVGSVRLGRQAGSGTLIINPTYVDRVDGSLDTEMLICGTAQTICMIEAAAGEVTEADLMSLLTTAQNILRNLETFQDMIISERAVAKRSISVTEIPDSLKNYFNLTLKQKLHDTVFSTTAGKDHLKILKSKYLTNCATTLPEVPATICATYFESKLNELLHHGAVVKNMRADGRSLDAIRPLFAGVGTISPVLHGSGIFYRGETHVLSVLTLGGREAVQIIDTMEERSFKKRFMHHYNFPPFSVGETGRVGGQNRRMVGHGALAEKALLPVIPDAASFPYTMRLVSETLSSNGSSSMASVCAASLALMDGGVPITRPVAGIALGLMFHNEDMVILTDIQGPEDEHGDMDFKVAGTCLGVTAIQMDVKVHGVPLPVIGAALEKGRLARLQILSTMSAVLAVPRAQVSKRVPEIVTLHILPEQIGLVIGSGGKTINAIKTETGVEEITIEDDGQVFITGRDGTAHQARALISAMTKRYLVGDELTVTITKIVPFGAFAALDTYHEGLLHISEIQLVKTRAVADILSVGMSVPVVVTKVVEGKIGLSIKQRDPEYFLKHLKTST